MSGGPRVTQQTHTGRERTRGTGRRQPFLRGQTKKEGAERVTLPDEKTRGTAPTPHETDVCESSVCGTPTQHAVQRQQRRRRLPPKMGRIKLDQDLSEKAASSTDVWGQS